MTATPGPLGQFGTQGTENLTITKWTGCSRIYRCPPGNPKGHARNRVSQPNSGMPANFVFECLCPICIVIGLPAPIAHGPPIQTFSTHQAYLTPDPQASVFLTTRGWTPMVDNIFETLTAALTSLRACYEASSSRVVIQESLVLQILAQVVEPLSDSSTVPRCSRSCRILSI